MQSPQLNSGDQQNEIGGFLGWIEKSGNKLPDPVFLFLWLILGLVVISVIASLTGLSAAHPTAIDPATGTNVSHCCIEPVVTRQHRPFVD